MLLRPQHLPLLTSLRMRTANSVAASGGYLRLQRSSAAHASPAQLARLCTADMSTGSVSESQQTSLAVCGYSAIEPRSEAVESVSRVNS